MSYDFYRILHFLFLFFFFVSLGGLWLFYSSDSTINKKFKRVLMLIHGLSLFVIFVAGFGLIAKLKIPTPWPLWIYIKMVIWLLLGLSPLLLKKGWPKISSKKISSALSLSLFFILIVISVTAARIKY